MWSVCENRTFLPAALKWLLPLYVTIMSASSMGLSCLMRYSCSVLVFRTVILTDHMQDTTNNTTSSPQKSLWSNKWRYCLNDNVGVHPLARSASTTTPYVDINAMNLFFSTNWQLFAMKETTILLKYLLGK